MCNSNIAMLCSNNTLRFTCAPMQLFYSTTAELCGMLFLHFSLSHSRFCYFLIFHRFYFAFFHPSWSQSICEAYFQSKNLFLSYKHNSAHCSPESQEESQEYNQIIDAQENTAIFLVLFEGYSNCTFHLTEDVVFYGIPCVIIIFGTAHFCAY